MLKALKIKYKGERNDVYSANAYALKCMLVSFAVLLFSWILDMLNIFIVDISIMTTATVGAAAICIIALAYAFLVGIDSKPSSFVVMFLLVAMATVICTELAYHTTMFMLFPLVCSAQYFDKHISWFTAISTCIGCAVAVMLGYRIGLCDSNMILLTYTDSAFHTAALTSGDFDINRDTSLMFLFFVFPRWLIILALMPLLNHVARDIQKRTERESIARRMAEIDGLTGAYNRTSYLQQISTKYPKCNQLAVLFFDVNNLKQVNDSKGHEYGDMLIRELADALNSMNTDTCKSYRIGGDEFVMIMEEADGVAAQDMRRTIENSIQNKKIADGVFLSVAVGMSWGKGKNVENIVNEADEQMYKDKTSVKEEGGRNG